MVREATWREGFVEHRAGVRGRHEVGAAMERRSAFEERDAADPSREAQAGTRRASFQNEWLQAGFAQEARGRRARRASTNDDDSVGLFHAAAPSEQCAKRKDEGRLRPGPCHAQVLRRNAQNRRVPGRIWLRTPSLVRGAPFAWRGVMTNGLGLVARPLLR